MMGLDALFLVVIPYASGALFISGIIYRILKWSSAPVPFRITTTSGQQKSLPWIKSSNLESPHNTAGVLGRMFLEVLFFRSLFRNMETELSTGKNLSYGSSKWLWLGAMVFHWSFLVIAVRHLRLFTEPVLSLAAFLQDIDGAFEIGLPVLYVSNVLLLLSLSYLFVRRITNSQVRYISLFSDYFAVVLILGIAISGIIMRYFTKIDVVAVKELAIGLISFAPAGGESFGTMFFIHVFLVCLLLGYFPFSKLVHGAGVFLSPTRNLANTSRMKRHVNPWDYPVKVRTYEEWEDEFRDRLGP
jgi:nitrate reductase gamma subunit